MKSVQEQERLRSEYIVQKFKASRTEHTPDIETLPPNPLQKRNFNDRNTKTFDETSHHRDYAAIRCVGKEISCLL